MTTRIITFCYRKIIGAAATKTWDKLVFEDTYAEFRMQAQLYNPDKKYRSFGQLLQQVPAAEKLHFLVSAAVTGYVQQLHETIPDIVNILGKHFLPFNRFQFEIINSDIQDKSKHQVAIHFYSTPLRWHDTIDNFLLISEDKETESDQLTHLVQLQPYLTIYSLRTLI